MGRQRFGEALLNAVDFAFHSLGKSCQQALYFHLEKTFDMGKLEIPNKVEEFDKALKSIFKDGAVFFGEVDLEETV